MHTAIAAQKWDIKYCNLFTGNIHQSKTKIDECRKRLEFSERAVIQTLNIYYSLFAEGKIY